MMSASLNSRAPMAGLSTSGVSPSKFAASPDRSNANDSTGVGGTGHDKPTIMGKYFTNSPQKQLNSSSISKLAVSTRMPSEPPAVNEELSAVEKSEESQILPDKKEGDIEEEEDLDEQYSVPGDDDAE